MLLGGSGGDAARSERPRRGRARLGGRRGGARRRHATAAPKQPARAKRKRPGKFDNPFFDPPSPKAEGAGARPDAKGGAAGSTRAEANRRRARPRRARARPRRKRPLQRRTRMRPRRPTRQRRRRRPAAPATPAPATPAATATPATPVATRAPSGPSTALRYLRTAVRVNGNGGSWPRPMARLTPIGGAATPPRCSSASRPPARATRSSCSPRTPRRSGDATCKRATECRLIGLKAGQTQVVTVRRSGGGVRRFSLQVRSIRAVWGSAARARERARPRPRRRPPGAASPCAAGP